MCSSQLIVTVSCKLNTVVQGSISNYTLRTTITRVITALEWQSFAGYTPLETM